MRTFGCVAGLVVLGEPAEVQVLQPGHPLLVLLIVGLLGPLHDARARTKTAIIVTASVTVSY